VAWVIVGRRFYRARERWAPESRSIVFLIYDRKDRAGLPDLCSGRAGVRAPPPAAVGGAYRVCLDGRRRPRDGAGRVCRAQGRHAARDAEGRAVVARNRAVARYPTSPRPAPAGTRSGHGHHDMREAVIVSAARTPTGKFLGSLKEFTAPQLGALAVREAVRRAGIDPAAVDECIMGNVVSAGE